MSPFDLARQYIAILNAPTFEEIRTRLSPLLAEDIEFQEPSAEGPSRGRGPFLEAVSITKTAFPDMEWLGDALYLDEEGCSVAIQWRGQGHHLGPYVLGGSKVIEATGEAIQLSGFLVLGFEGAKIVKFRGFPDKLALLMQLGQVELKDE